MKTIIALVSFCLFSFRLVAQVSFTISSTPGVGISPYVVASADVNGDGKPDLITANSGDNSLTVLTNNGSGGFALAGTYAVGSIASAVTVADVNGDGKPDLISANSAGNTLSVLTNTGNGSFALSATLGVGNYPYAVTAADINDDGKVDLISANYLGNNLSILTNNGSGGFVLSSSPSVGGIPESVIAVDVNGDGKLDLASANAGGNSLSVLTNNGSGGFVTAGTYALTQPTCVTAADVNGDGKPDLIGANYGNGTLSVYTNNGSGGFALSTSPGVDSGPYGVTSADVNGDGKPDLISANALANTLSILTNSGNGSFTLAASPSVGSAPFFVIAADLSMDGKVDLISANNGDNTLSILTNSTPFPPPSIPIITTQPIGRTNVVGASVSFSVAARAATGIQLFNYQWRLAGTNLPTATNNILQLPNLALNQAGIYTVVVANSAGSVTSSPAILDVRFIAIFVNGQIAPLNVTNIGSAQVSFAGGYSNGFFYYTLDGSTPNVASTLYAGPFTLTSSAVVRVAGVSADFTQAAFAGPVNIQIIPTYTLQTSIIGSGTLTTNPPVGPYVSNTVVTLTATPAARWVFDRWAGDATNSQNPLNITMTGPRNLQAIFVQTSFPLTVSSPGGGSITTNGQTMASTTFFPVGTAVNLTAVPSNGWSFIRWTGSTNSTANPLSVTISQTNIIQAIFGTVVSTNSFGGGIVLNMTNPIPFGASLTVSAVPDAGNYFFGWAGSLSGTNSPAKLVVTNAAPSVGALFSALPTGKFSLSVIVVGGGFETNNPPRSYYNSGDVVSLRALTNGTELFLGWTRDASGTNNPLSITMTTNKIIQANFGTLPAVSITPLAQTVLAGSNMFFTASAIGIPPLAYQWWNNSIAIPGATNFVFAIANTQPTNAGNYFVVVTNLSGSVTSSLAVVTVIGAPIITNQPPALTTLTVGHAANFNVGAYGWPALAYQWKLNGATVNGATSNSFTLANAFPANAGNYIVVITNIYGSATSTPAALSVLPLGITAPKISAPGQFQFSFDTATGVSYAVQYSTNLTQWLPLFTVGGVGFPLTLTDPNTAGIRYRFYRVMVTP